MFITKALTAGSIILGGIFTLASSNYDVTSVLTPKVETEYFFGFTGINGQEDNPLMWDQITQNQYDEASCDGDYRGCTLISNSVTTTAGSIHPTQVEVNQDPNNPANQSPKLGSGVVEVQNKTSSY